MSMLAGQKTKPSWVLNPRASDWSKDQNKLGQKMLEKMGWSVGKGLGAKEQGRTEALRIAYKADVRGLGAKRKQERELALQQQENFQSFLQQLNGSEDRQVSVQSLEEKSKTARNRVHYHKFTRGKDISRYSQKDLSCIVGSGFVPVQSVDVPAPKSGEDESETVEHCSEGASSLTNSNGYTPNQAEADMNMRSGKKSGLQGELLVKKKAKKVLLLTNPEYDSGEAMKKKKKKKSKKGDIVEEVQLAKEDEVEEEEEDSKIKKRNKKERTARNRINAREMEIAPVATTRRSPRRKPEPEQPEAGVTKKKRKKAINEEQEHHPIEEKEGPTKAKKKKKNVANESVVTVAEAANESYVSSRKKLKSGVVASELPASRGNRRTTRKRGVEGSDDNATDAANAGPSSPSSKRKNKTPVADLNCEYKANNNLSPKKKRKGPNQEEVVEKRKSKTKKKSKRLGQEEASKDSFTNFVSYKDLQGSKKKRNKLEDISHQDSTDSKESSTTQKEAEDNETEQGSTISQTSSSFLHELLGRRKSLGNEIVVTNDYEKWHLLNRSVSEEEVDSEEEMLTGFLHRD